MSESEMALLVEFKTNYWKGRVHRVRSHESTGKGRKTFCGRVIGGRNASGTWGEPVFALANYVDCQACRKNARSIGIRL